MESVEKMIAIVQCYIHALKEKEVIIIIRNDRDILLLITAYNNAVNYFKRTNTIIKQV